MLYNAQVSRQEGNWNADLGTEYLHEPNGFHGLWNCCHYFELSVQFVGVWQCHMPLNLQMRGVS